MKVLSIDWDYFIDATAVQRFSMFPDGGNENVPYYLRNIIWASHYNGELEKIGIKEKDLEIAKDLIAHNFDSIMIADSHKHIYEFIEENYLGDCIDVTNIDFHHDLYGMNNIGRQEVDCGNWMVKLFDEYDCTYAWINQSDSDKSVDNDEFCKINEINIEKIKNEKFDLLYICKSSIWSPPHLDKYFIDAFSPLIHQDKIEVRYETTVFDDRYNKEFLKIVHQNQEYMRQTKERIQNIDR